MDWILIIILGIGLPIIGGLIGISMVAKKYSQMKDDPQEFGLSPEEDVRKNFGKFVILVNQHITGMVYGVLIIILFWFPIPELDAPDDQLSRLGVTLALAIGVPVLFGNISLGIVLSKGIEAIVKNPKNFGRVLLYGGIQTVPMVIALLVAILSLLYSGLLGNEYLMTQAQIDGLFNAVLIFSILSSGILISGILVNRMEKPFEIQNLPKGILNSSAGVMVPIMGFIYFILKCQEFGFFANTP